MIIKVYLVEVQSLWHFALRVHVILAKLMALVNRFLKVSTLKDDANYLNTSALTE